MELRLASGLKSIQQSTPTTGKKKASVPLPAEKALPRSDQLALSKQAVAYLEEQNRRIMEQARRDAKKYAAEGSDGKSTEEAELEAIAKAMDKMRKCHEIAARIMRGDKVPPEDEQYLMQNDPDGYKLALAARKPKKDPKEWKSILDEADKNGGTENAGETDTSEGVETSGTTEGSGAGTSSSGGGGA